MIRKSIPYLILIPALAFGANRPVRYNESTGDLIDPHPAPAYNLSDIGRTVYKAATKLTISSGVVTVTQMLHTIDGESDLDDDLQTINGGVLGQKIIIWPENTARNITLINGTGNIITNSGLDYTIPDNGIVTLIYDGSNWRVIGNSIQTSTGIYRIEWIDIGAMISRTTNGATTGSEEYATNDIMSDYALFDKDTDEAVQFRWGMPRAWNLGTVKIKIYWTAASGSGDVVWGIRARATGNDDAIDGAFGTAVTVTDTLIAASDIHETNATPAMTIGGTPALGDFIWFEVYRDADAAGDTFSADVKLLGVRIQYLENTTPPTSW